MQAGQGGTGRDERRPRQCMTPQGSSPSSEPSRALLREGEPDAAQFVRSVGSGDGEVENQRKIFPSTIPTATVSIISSGNRITEFEELEEEEEDTGAGAVMPLITADYI